MKKKLTLVVTCVVLVAAMVIGGTLAYFTDTDKATNTFTVGNVKMDLLESSLHRENAGVANGVTSTSELWSDVAKEGSGNTSKYKAGDTFYTDAQIEENAAGYTCENEQLIPGRSGLGPWATAMWPSASSADRLLPSTVTAALNFRSTRGISTPS